MKRMLCLLLIALLTCALTVASADSVHSLFQRTLFGGGEDAPAEQSALDAAFEADRLTLVKADGIRITAEDFDFTDAMLAAMGQQSVSSAELRAAAEELVSSGNITLMSLSPTGNSGFLTLNGTPAAYYGGKVRMLYPSAERGVEDTYENLKKYYEHLTARFSVMIGEEGIQYSPDGRYAIILNIRLSLINGQFFLDPILIDLSTGEVILTATYPTKISQENMAVATTATFSADGRYLYYMTYGHIDDTQTQLYRYDLESGTTELCRGNTQWLYYPHLCEVGPESFIIISDTNRTSEQQKLVSLQKADDRWVLREHQLPVLRAFYYANKMSYSAASGHGFLLGRNDAGAGYYGLSPISARDDYAGLNQVVCFTGGKAVTLSPEEYQAQVEAAGRALPEGEQGRFGASFGYDAILQATLSPDGRYVLLLTENQADSSRGLYLLRLEDLAMREIGGIAPETIQVGAFGRDYPIQIEWNTDTLIIGTEDGVQTYQFQ